MIQYKTKEEIEIIKEGAYILSNLLGQLSKEIKPGINTLYLDKIVEEYIYDHGAKPSFKGYKGYKYNSCISVNDQVVHALPCKYELKEGDICSIDCGVYYNKYHSDSAFTYFVGEIDKNIAKFLKITKKSLDLALESISLDSKTGDVGHKIQTFIESAGYSVIKDLVGHGIGKELHEDPEFPNFGPSNSGSKILNGMVFAIEPMTAMGANDLIYENDGWTIRTLDKSLSAHFEHTIAFIENKAKPLTTFDYISKEFLLL